MTFSATLSSLLFFALLLLASCGKEVVEFNTFSDSAICDPRGLFARTKPDGPCTRCRTEAGMIALGRNGEYCLDPNSNYYHDQIIKMVQFDTLPGSWWPSDTMYMAYRLSNSPTTGGGFSTIGFNYIEDSPWRQSPGCPAWSERGINQKFIDSPGPDFDSFRTSDGDQIFDNGNIFSFEIWNADVNEDCYPDRGFATGFVRNDTAFAEIIWKVELNPVELFGDTLKISQAIITDPPSWIQ